MKFLRLHHVKAMTGLSRSTIYRYAKQGIFPVPAKVGLRSIAWVEAEVLAWIAERISERDQSISVAAG